MWTTREDAELKLRPELSINVQTFWLYIQPNLKFVPLVIVLWTVFHKPNTLQRSSSEKF